MQPTAPELEILKLLWQSEPLTGKEIHQKLAELYGWGYSSTRKTLERMVAKDFVRAQQQGNKNIFFAELEKLPTLAAFVKDFSARVLEINQPLPSTMFAESQLLKEDELAELESLLQSADNNKEG